MTESVPLFDMGLPLDDETTPDTSDFDLFADTSRRDKKLLVTELADVKAQDTLTLLFRDDRYGTAVIQGPVYVSEAQGVPRLLVAGVTVAQSKKESWEPDTALRKVLSDDTEFSGAEVGPGGIEHGDLLTAEFSHDAYGDFTITALASRGTADTLAVLYGWIVSQQNGETGKHTSTVQKVAAPDTHNLVIPALRTPYSTE